VAGVVAADAVMRTIAVFLPIAAMSALERQIVDFNVPLGSAQGLTLFKPKLPSGWFYLGPVARSNIVGKRSGMIVRAVDSDSLTDIVDWKQVAPNQPDSPYSTWRGIAPEGYVAVGDFFVLGQEKPTAQQTAGMKAIRKQHVNLMPPQRLVWEGRVPMSLVSVWDVIAAPRLFVPTGAFVSNDDENPGGNQIAVVLFDALE